MSQGHVVGLIDYRAGNLLSIENAFRHVGAEVRRVTAASDFDDLTHAVLPGVGAFGHCRSNLDASGLIPALTDWAIARKRPTLGICVGMQLMAEIGLEHGRTAGLGWFTGAISPLSAEPPLHRIPHVGWNEILLDRDFGGLAAGTRMDVYFDHSFALIETDAAHVLATCSHSSRFTALLHRDNILAAQFHPEKSQQAGLRLITEFLAMQG